MPSRATTEVDELTERVKGLVGAQDRLLGVLRASQIIVADLTLPVVLTRIVEAARELVEANYAALGVIDPDGGHEQFVHVGMDESTVERIGRLPFGKGLLGALIQDPHPIRLAHLGDDHRSVGLPPHHPPMDSFLGVAIRIRDRVYGNLYLAESRRGEFSAEDQEVITSLAASAASAIENARLYEQGRRRQDWLAASTEVTRQLLTVDGEQPLAVMARWLADLAGADAVNVVVPTPDGVRLMVEVATGAGAAELTATTYPLEGTLSGLAIRSGRPVLIGDATQEGQRTAVHLSEVVDIGPAMAIPLVGSHGALGALVVGRLRGRPRFSDADLEMATTFANHATVALELADARADQQRVFLLEDRDRIARDLHDHVIQRMFAAGLTVQSVASSLAGDERGQRLDRVVDDLDSTIRQIRTSIFELRGALAPGSATIRDQLVDVATQLTPALGFAPHVQFSGAIDALAPESALDDIVAVLREALTNVARHAQASAVDVRISAGSREFSIEVCDDGVGLRGAAGRSGLTNLASRAARYGGTLTTSKADPDDPSGEGTCVRWSIPL